MSRASNRGSTFLSAVDRGDQTFAAARENPLLGSGGDMSWVLFKEPLEKVSTYWFLGGQKEYENHPKRSIATLLDPSGPRVFCS